MLSPTVYGYDKLLQRAQKDPQWIKKLQGFFGSPRARLGTYNKSKDECIGFIAAQIYGKDPLEGERRTIEEENTDAFSSPYVPREQDRMAYLFIVSGLADIPPKWLKEFLSSPEGKMLKDQLVRLLGNQFNVQL